MQVVYNIPGYTLVSFHCTLGGGGGGYSSLNRGHMDRLRGHLRLKSLLVTYTALVMVSIKLTY